MTRDEILAMTETELDKAIATIRNDLFRYFIAVMDVEEKGYCANVSESGPWRTEYQLQQWLIDEQKHGRYKDYHIVKYPRYDHYSTDVAKAHILLGEAVAEWNTTGAVAHWYIINNASGKWVVQICVGGGTSRTPVIDKSLATAICRMYLMYKEQINE